MKVRNLFANLLLALSFAALSVTLRAEDVKPVPKVSLSPGDIQTAVFTIQHADMKTLQDQLITLPGYFNGGSIRFDDGSRTLFVIGSKELVAACAEAIKRLDVPSKPTKNIELTFYILLASKKPLPGSDCPAVIQSFCDQMKGIYKGFRLLETLSIRTRECSTRETVRGVIAATEPGGDAMPYGLRYSQIQLIFDDKDPKPMIRLNVEFWAEVKVKQGSTISDKQVAFDTSVDFREGQEVGLTTLSQGTPGESLCIVAKAKVVD